MSQFTTIQNTMIYLHSYRNRRLYPRSHYPMTHRLDEFNRLRLRLKGSINVHHFKCSSIIFLAVVLIGMIFFQLHIRIYNSIFGPFHFNLIDFAQHVNTYQNNYSYLSFLGRKEYIQLELGENMFLDPISKYTIIKQYFDRITRNYHIATYKRLRKPSIYVKLPTASQSRYHTRLPFHFKSYTIPTLQCIVRNLPSNSADTYRTWVEKFEYVRYIDDQYTKNSTEFNKAVLTKCGVLIGYLYRPKGEIVFTASNQYKFATEDLALNTTHQYFSPYLYVILGLLFMGLFLKSLFDLMRFLCIRLRCDYLHKVGILPWPLKLLPDVAEELWLLNIDGSLFEQLIKFDEYLERSEHKYNNRLAVIENDQHDLFVVLLRINSDKDLDVADKSSPFIICPVTDIHKIKYYQGICYGSDESLLPWPTLVNYVENYSAWLHDILMEISEIYKTRYQSRLQCEQSPTYSIQTETAVHGSRVRYRQKQRNVMPQANHLEQLIREEETTLLLQFERRDLDEIQTTEVLPASPQFIASFRLAEENSNRRVTIDMDAQRISCSICYSYLTTDQHYSQWPCSNSQPHLFHYECQLSLFRSANRCPVCRHEVESAAPMLQQDTPQIIRRVFL
ncbi:unnamed protein product [Rotaria magnacalcarata]|uniref:RING-type domain-containing protein n=4 Tax=Rotaria magnacalcarata TaxID=392030 RepID=A0A816BFV3_9BILA|nr:unnamed protein product [Rotaria magnacalcarata]CAF1610278.1 unnamed protein product [Rotaria magnacalcarata]CAF2060343.1 unnamed protein product [Rotaria magnacalcarata]CAF4735353.1 unnamed protein product [Rotaria magnacalcarata]